MNKEAADIINFLEEHNLYLTVLIPGEKEEDYWVRMTKKGSVIPFIKKKMPYSIVFGRPKEYIKWLKSILPTMLKKLEEIENV